MTLNDRFAIMLDHLQLSQNRAGIEIGVTASQINSVLNGTTPRIDFIEKVLHAFPEINPEWLVLGKGDMLRKESASAEVTFAEFFETNVLLVPHRAQAGYAENFTDIRYLSEHFVPVHLPFIKKKNVRGFEVEGDSMEKADGEGLHDGDWVFATRTDFNPDTDLAHQIRQGRLYVMVHSEGFSVKRIRKDPGTDYMTAFSDNVYYKPRRFELSQLKELWYCHGAFSFHMPPPDTLDVRVARNEQDIFSVRQDLSEIKTAVGKLVEKIS